MSTVLYYTVLYYTILYCMSTVLYYTIQYILYCTVLQHSVQYYSFTQITCHVFINHYRFDTSYSLLRILLEDQSKKTITSPTWLPIVKLWPSLIAAACDLTGEERIKLIGLLLQVLCLNSKIGSTNGASVAAGVQKLDLTLLKPLWSLYTAMSKEYGVI